MPGIVTTPIVPARADVFAHGCTTTGRDEQWIESGPSEGGGVSEKDIGGRMLPEASLSVLGPNTWTT